MIVTFLMLQNDFITSGCNIDITRIFTVARRPLSMFWIWDKREKFYFLRKWGVELPSWWFPPRTSTSRAKAPKEVYGTKLGSSQIEASHNMPMHASMYWLVPYYDVCDILIFHSEILNAL